MNRRLYAPHVKQGKRWVRATYKDGSMMPGREKKVAIRVYQNWLLAPFMEGVNEIRELRPLPKEAA